ncbi:hypothetical protein JQS43_02410 [Natronosporangium hydrolyticum]|uniref:Alpha-L-glutamate ligase-related protein ATP-grasp domain-containing protein n=1 Tax=Natronosporangium hydrolyticum TaxID=2811111 RepID=A0A895YMU5_9ACTN|nr:sugar-transfer associated ATP-grasp domain-containing protein [Natronosporangium hydrolyticum]QSB15238.1 hypothetical protein JQS43_02410 [Natronosporangium hydrolyticum]
MLLELSDPQRSVPIGDKAAFAARAQGAGLAVVSTLAVVTAGEIKTFAELPRADLFVKLLDGRHGKKAEKWFYLPEHDAYERHGGKQQVGRASFLESLAAASANKSIIVQPCLTNHPDIADIALDAVATCRLITIVNEHGEPEPIIATFRMPALRDTFVDNMHRGGLAAPVDIKTGTLGAATDYATAGPGIRHETHPATGAAIAGSQLPGWQDVLELARAAHHCFSPRILIGWDISIGPHRPIIIEGNEYPGVGGLQRLHNQPLGSHRFGQLLVHHLLDNRRSLPAVPEPPN